MAALGQYIILTGLEMIQTVSNVPQILNSGDEPLSLVAGQLGTPRPSKTFFSAFLQNLDTHSEVDSQVKFFVLVPQPLDVSGGSGLYAADWSPFLTFTPANSDAAASTATFNIPLFPDPVTRILEVDLAVETGALVCSFFVSIDFKHSIV
jgi:hypothetical protein